MTFLRPEAVDTLTRWREALIGLGLILFATWWGLGSHGFVRGAAIVIGAVGLAVLWGGIRRARFRPDSAGAGVVEVTERQITYFAPEGGHAVSLDALATVSIALQKNGPAWLFADETGKVLEIPVGARGAELLYDAVSALPGVDYPALLRAVDQPTPLPTLIWGKPRPRLH